MDLTSVSNVELLNRVEKLAQSERKITHLILWHLVEVETRRLYLDLGFTSLFKYMTSQLQYSEDAAYRRIQAARLLKKVPQLNHAIENGDLNLTQLHRVQKCLTKELENGNPVSLEKTEGVLELIQNKSSMETQKILAIEFNQPIQMHETIKPQRDDSIRMEISVSPEQMADLEHAKDLLSHALPNPTWAELFAYLAKKHIQTKLGKENRKDLNFVKPNIAKKSRQRDSVALATKDSNSADSVLKNNANEAERIHKRKHIKTTLRRTLLVKSNHHCEYLQSDGRRCLSTYQLQVDHKLPLAMGGANDIQNFRILCRTHNLSEARRLRISKY
ncbi:HNH endonuclease [Bdellovibrio sp. KM01]|uniref:HNH endonuclease n=1 Tax=Bdellovibrio sp. KM01 TaxID=2748865 RepID=UPI0015E8F685|nr:HNH endonuclease signature motif containing protein [Bdellovibrio sp. KM01]QLY26613.1 HNH endonuclease [Bdellovibrio sp. KM01]